MKRNTDKICPICGAEKKPLQSNQVYITKDGEKKEYNYTQWRCQKRHFIQKERQRLRSTIKDDIRYY
jgi:hypothetical protein